MALYADNIQTSLYKYNKPIYITETSGEDRSLIPLRLDLNRSNFNFDLARSDGLDFRIAERQNGTGVLLIWIAYWDSAIGSATIWCKLPYISAGDRIELWAFWGFAGDSGMSDINTLVDSDPVFLFADDFAGDILDTSNWIDESGNYIIQPDSIELGVDTWIESKVLPINRGNFIVEDGILGINSPSITTIAVHRYRFYGGDNVMGVDYYWNGSTDRRLDVETAGTYVVYDGLNRGLIVDEYTQTYIGYYESTDKVYQGMRNRGGNQQPLYSDNIAIGGTAYASDSHGGNPPANAFDDDLNTTWGAIQQVPSGTWIGYEFLTAVVFTRVMAYNFGIAGYYQSDHIDIEIQGSNDLDNPDWALNEWDTLYSITVSNTPADHEWLFNNTTAYKRIRLVYAWKLFGEPVLAEMTVSETIGYSGEFDYDDSWERKVHRNTEITNFRIYGADNSSAQGVAINWVIAREFDPTIEPFIDLSNLFVQYEYVSHQQLDYSEYGTDVTSVDFYHSSDMGGDPYKMSNDISTDILESFVSNDGVTQGSIIIDFGRLSEVESNKNYLHLDDGHVGYYTAAKLSDLDGDVHNNTYWLSNKLSGWAAIKFPARKTIASFKVNGVSSNLSGMVKNYNFYGSNKDPRFSGWTDKILLHSGVFLQQAEEQLVYLKNTSSYFYYILEAVDTYGANIALQEWAMYRRTPDVGKKVISQLRLKPVVDTINEYYFSKQIKLEASNDLITWTTLLNTIDTPTPFTNYVYGRWSRYSFDNYEGYYTYKLTCYDNWKTGEDVIKISEWEMVERIEEASVYRILGGSTSNINSVWADDSTDYDSGHFYIVNDKLNTVKVNELVEITTISGTTSDINVKGS